MAQQLAPLTESHLHKLAEQLDIDNKRLGMRHHAHNGAVHAGGRVKAVGRHQEYVFHGVAPLQHHAQSPIVSAAGLGHHAVYDFLLQHEMLVFNDSHRVQQMEKNGRGNVVGKIADHAYFAERLCLAGHAFGKRRKVNFEHVGFDHLELRMGLKLTRKVPVQFDHSQVA